MSVLKIVELSVMFFSTLIFSTPNTTLNSTLDSLVKPQASPVLKDSVIKALKMADNPTQSGPKKYYDFWKEWTNKDNDGDHKEPKFKLLGSGSDHAPFAFYLNIPAINLRFKDDNKKYPGVGQYPMYHTGYETFFLWIH